LNIIVCYKVTPDPEDIKYRPDRTLDFSSVEWRIGAYDLVAVEAAAQLAEATGGTLSALSAGPAELENSKSRKEILARGSNDLYQVIDEQLRDIDTHVTAQVLAAAIRKRGPFDLVVCGEGSSDLYAQQVGVQLGQLLDVPTLNAISKITPAGGQVIVERIVGHEVEVLEVPLPAVLSVTTDIYLPRILGMKDILGASKKPITQWTLADVGIEALHPALQPLETLAPAQADRKRIIREGESEEVVSELVSSLRKEGVL
jgi:electron transfer flavoprotein beta subunit